MEIIEMETTYELIDEWLTKVVIGLNLCPFAARPKQMDLIDIVVSDAQSQAELLAELQVEMHRLADTPATVLETTLLAAPLLLHSFSDYNDFLMIADRLLSHCGYEGVLQIASFHPEYQFEGTLPDDRQNLTNRSPVPIFHLLREASIADVLSRYKKPERIPARNIERMESLSGEEIKHLFHYLMKK